MSNTNTIQPNLQRVRARTLMECLRFVSGRDLVHWIWEPLTNTVFFDEVFIKKTGCTHQSIPKSMSEVYAFIHPDDMPSLLKAQRTLVYQPECGDFKEGTLRFRLATGEYTWIFGRLAVVQRNAEGFATKLCGMYVHFEDMAQKQDAYYVESDRLRHALDANGAGPWDWNIADNSIYFSQQYCAILGYTQEEFAHNRMSWAGYLHPEDYETTLMTHFKHIHSAEHGDYFKTVSRIRHKSGVYKWIVSNGKVVERDAKGKAVRIIGLHTDVTQVKADTDELIHALHYDSLTGVCSRFYFDKCIAQTDQRDFPISIICADVDGLKLVNDHLGHRIGDKVLVAAAQILNNTLPERTLIGRVGGDEFTVLVSHCNEATAENLLNRLYMAVRERNSHAKMPVYISFGAATTHSPQPIHKLISAADANMLNAKRDKHNEHRATIAKWIESKTRKPVDLLDRRIAHNCDDL